MQEHSKVVSPHRQKLNEVTEQQQLARKKNIKEKGRNTDKHSSCSDSRDCPISNTRRESIRKALSQEALANFWSRLAHGIVSTRVYILSRATCVCVCIHLHIRCISQKKANCFSSSSFFFILPIPESLFCVFPKAQEKENMEMCSNNNDENKRKLSTQTKRRQTRGHS